MDAGVQQTDFIVRQYRVVFPRNLNPNRTMFGGDAMQWLDEAAFITATRFSRQRMITVNVSDVRFLKPILPNTILVIEGRVVRTGHVKVQVHAEAYAEDMYSERKEKAIEADFVFAPCDDDLKPVPLKKRLLPD